MIAVDSSALIAMLLDEPERERFAAIVNDAGAAVISSATVIEARMVAHGRGGEARVKVLDGIIDALGLEVIHVGTEDMQIAHAAFVTYGKGSGHAARLNFGDLFSYALAKARDVPLLFKGDDFSQTDIEPAAR